MPVRSETPGPLIRYFLRYERHSSFLRTTEKNRHQPSVSPVRSEIPGSQVRYFLRYERYNLYCRTIGKTKTTIRMSLMSSKSPMSSPAKWICLIHTIPRIGHPRQRNGIDFCFCLRCGRWSFYHFISDVYIHPTLVSSTGHGCHRAKVVDCSFRICSDPNGICRKNHSQTHILLRYLDHITFPALLLKYSGFGGTDISVCSNMVRQECLTYLLNVRDEQENSS